MIPKASQRGGGQQLATHLMNAIDNERVEVLALRGAVARDLHGAFAEWEAQSTATKCRKYLYSLSINPDPRQRPLSREEIGDFIGRIETSLGLEAQPRALVCHVKGGREHFHVAWSRIDVEKMKAVQLSHDRHKIRAAALEFAREKGLEMPGRGAGRLTDKFTDRARRSTHAEMQQEERTGIPKAERQAIISLAWYASLSPQAFVRAMADHGYILAQGDKRGYVIVDRHGEIHSLARQIAGVNTKAVNQFLKDFPLNRLPAAAKIQRQAREKSVIHNKEYSGIRAEERRAALRDSQRSRRAALDRKQADLKERHSRERQALLAIQRDRNKAIARQRKEKEPAGLAAFLGKVTGITKRRHGKQRREDIRRLAAQRENIAQLARRQQCESRDLARQQRALARVEKRESRSLETKLKREIRTIPRRPPQRDLPAPEKTPAARPLAQEFQLTARAPTPSRANEKSKAPGREMTLPAAPGLLEKFAQISKDREAVPRPAPERKREPAPAKEPEQTAKTQEMRDAAQEILSPQLLERLRDRQAREAARDKDRGHDKHRSRDRSRERRR